MLTRLALLLAVLLAAGSLACKPEPTPGTVDVAGDSISYQAACIGNECHTDDVHPGDEGRPEDLQWHAWLGWRMRDARPSVEQAVADGRPEILVVALFTNDSSPTHGGWGWPEIAEADEFINLPHPDACVVVVLPWLGEGASQAHRDHIATARDTLPTVAANRDGPTVVVDWADVVGPDAHPEYLAEDGIHIRNTDEARAARLDLYWEGVTECGELLP